MAIGFKPPPAVGRLLLSASTADLSEDEETLDSDDDADADDLPSVKQILASLKRAKCIIDLTDDDDGEGGNGDFTEVSWLRTIRTARRFPRDSGDASSRP
jgi:hypothetical protein